MSTKQPEKVIERDGLIIAAYKEDYGYCLQAYKDGEFVAIAFGIDLEWPLEGILEQKEKDFPRKNIYPKYYYDPIQT